MELTISVVLLGILGVVGTTMFTGSFYTTKVINTQHLAYSEARYAIERMAREIREIQSEPSRISRIDPNQLDFVKTNLNGTTTAVSFKYVSPTLSMSYSAGAYYTLARNISSFTFTYLNANGSVTTDMNLVRFVDLALTVSAPEVKALTLTTRVRLRNL